MSAIGKPCKRRTQELHKTAQMEMAFVQNVGRFLNFEYVADESEGIMAPLTSASSIPTEIPVVLALREVGPNCFLIDLYCNAVQVLSGLNSVVALARSTVSIPRSFW